MVGWCAHAGEAEAHVAGGEGEVQGAEGEAGQGTPRAPHGQGHGCPQLRAVSTCICLWLCSTASLAGNIETTGEAHMDHQRQLPKESLSADATVLACSACRIRVC